MIALFQRRAAFVFGLLAAFAALVFRLLQSRTLWVEEAYGLAAARQVIAGHALYRGVWFDKPPLYALVYVLCGGQDGVPLRLLGAVYVLLAAYCVYRFAREVWGEREGYVAAGLLAFSLTFYLPSAVLALAPDLLLVVPHILAVWFAWRGQPFGCGVALGVGLQCNTKAVYVAAACCLWQYRSLGRLLLGFAIPCGLTALWLAATHSLADYWQQVWVWGFRYAGDPLYPEPWREGIRRTLNWSGFHVALLLGAAVGLRFLPAAARWRTLGWLAFSLIAVATGGRYFPRYYFQLLPPLALLAGRGLAQTPGAYLLVFLAIPLVRFGRAPSPDDLALMRDAQAAATFLKPFQRPGDTLLVWGYRPELYLFTKLPAGTRFLDSQPLTGVLADRHLTSSKATFPELAAGYRATLEDELPTFVIDGLGTYNPRLSLTEYNDLQSWLVHYRVRGRTAGCVIYERRR